ncbi:hypothetical protein MASR2M66_23950 [Chloroflexota bacterium]
MKNKLMSFFKAPVFPNDPEKSQRANSLNALHLNMAGSLLLLGVPSVLFIFPEKICSSAIIAALFFSAILSMFLNYRGRVKASAFAILAPLWALTLFMTIISGGMQSLDVLFFISGTVIAGISLGLEGALLYAALSLLAGLGLITAENLGVIFPRLFTFPSFSVWVILFVNLLFTVMPLQATLKSLASAAAQARANEERYRLITSVISDYVFSIQYGPDGEIAHEWTDGAFETITGYPPNEYFARGGWDSIVYPEDREQDLLDRDELKSNRKVISEVRLVQKNGSIRWVRAYAHPVWDAQHNQLAGIYGAVQDITEQKTAGYELSQHMEEVSILYQLGGILTAGQNLYETLRAFVRDLKNMMVVDAFHVGMYDAETDIFSYSLFLNLDKDFLPPPRKMSASPGLTWEVISGKKTLYLKDVTDPEIKKRYNIVVIIDAPIRSYVGIPLLLQDRAIGIMSVQALRPEAYSDEQIRLLEILAAQVVITIEKMRLLSQLRQELADRKKADAELQQREAILEVVAKAANTFLNMSAWSMETWQREVNNLLDQLGAAISASHAYVFENHQFDDDSIRMSMRCEWTAPGFQNDIENPSFQNMPIGQDDLTVWHDLIVRGFPFVGDAAHLTPEDVEKLDQRGIKALLDVPIFVDGEWWGIIGFDDMAINRNWSNSEVGALILASNLMGAAIKRRQMDTLLQNELVQRKDLIDELGSKNVELERFSYSVSHDLRSPLVTIQGFLGYLKKNALEGNLAAFQKDFERISNATLRMDKLLKDLLELSRIGRVLNKPQDTPFDALVREALEIVHGRLMQGSITVQTQPNLPIVRGDKPRLIEVLQNLIDNAAKYMGDQPSPHIEIGQQGEEDGRLIFYVKDNGIGIAPEYYERIFRLFDKLDPVSDGTGVGLALVKRIIEFHGGQTWVESQLGEGSTFYFTLPKADA